MAGPRSSPLLLCLLVASALLLGLGVGVAAPGDVVYDQRQSGNYNVHVRVQDVGIFAVLGRSSNSDSSQDDDVYEDYNDPVENDEDPNCCKGISPANTTEANTTSTTTTRTTSTTTTSTTPSTTTTSTTSKTPSTTTTSTTSTVTTPVPSTTKKRKKLSTVAVTNTTRTTTTAPTRRRRCHVGYVRDQRGRCRRIQRVTEST